MPKILGHVVTMTVILVFSGCASIGSTPTFMLPAGSQVEVNQDLSASSGARVSIQYGRVVPRSQITVVDAHCQFFLYRSPGEMRDAIVIQPGIFTVKRTYQRQADDGVQLAGTQLASDRTRYPTTIMELYSNHQPEVRDLRCAIWGTTYAEGFLTINRMQDVLGDLVKLTIVTK